VEANLYRREILDKDQVAQMRDKNVEYGKVLLEMNEIQMQPLKLGLEGVEAGLLENRNVG
jgi:hypothetical protein